MIGGDLQEKDLWVRISNSHDKIFVEGFSHGYVNHRRKLGRFEFDGESMKIQIKWIILTYKSKTKSLCICGSGYCHSCGM
jgi:hypothetical protein